MTIEFNTSKKRANRAEAGPDIFRSLTTPSASLISDQDNRICMQDQGSGSVRVAVEHALPVNLNKMAIHEDKESAIIEYLVN